MEKAKSIYTHFTLATQDTGHSTAGIAVWLQIPHLPSNRPFKTINTTNIEQAGCDTTNIEQAGCDTTNIEQAGCDTTNILHLLLYLVKLHLSKVLVLLVHSEYCLNSILSEII